VSSIESTSINTSHILLYVLQRETLECVT